MVTLKQFEAFYWAATCPSFAVAAGKICLSVSSLSKRIAELERTFGVTLFDRSGHRAVLSPSGVELLPRAWEILSATEKLVEDMGRGEPLMAPLKIGAGELSAMTWLPKLVRLVQERKPKTPLETIVAVGGELERRLIECELDVAIVANRSSDSAIASQWIGEARFEWYGACANPCDLNFASAALEALPLVSLPAESGAARLVDEWLRARGMVPRRRIICNHWGAIAGMLQQGLGVAALPSGWGRRIASAYDLRSLASPHPLPKLEYFIQWRADDYRSIISFLRESAGNTADFNTHL